MRRFALLWLVTACWRSSPPPPPPPPAPAPAPMPITRTAPPVTENERALQAFEQFADDMCNCHDAQCASDVADEMTKWSRDDAGKRDEPRKMNNEELERASMLGERLGSCMQKAMAGGAGGSATP